MLNVREFAWHFTAAGLAWYVNSTLYEVTGGASMYQGAASPATAKMLMTLTVLTCLNVSLLKLLQI